MKKVILSVLALGALALPVVAVEAPKELVFATFKGMAPESREVTGSVTIVEDGIKFKIMDADPLLIPFDAMPILRQSLEELKK